MNANNSEWTRSRRLSFLLLGCFFGGLTIYLFLTSSYTDYYTLFGFHLQKRGLGSILFADMFVGAILAYATTQSKISKVSVLVVFAASLFLSPALIIPTLLKFNWRVNNGTLVEKLGDIPPLMMAAYKADLQEMERLIKSGVSVDTRNNVDNTALHFAAGATPIQNQVYFGSPAAVAYLIARGADVNAQNNTKITPLMDAVINNNLESLKILIAHGADVNKESKYSETALSMAMIRLRGARSLSSVPLSREPFIRRYRDIAIELLHHGADPNFKDFTGRTPLQVAEKIHEDDLVNELKKYGAKE